MTYHLNFRFACLSLLACWLLGCSGGGVGRSARPPGDAKDVLDLMASMQDFARTRDTFTPLFVEGKAPDENARRSQYSKLAFYPDEPKFEGDRATVQVEVMDPDSDAEVGEKMEWVAVKVGGKWKLDNAPIPPSLGRR